MNQQRRPSERSSLALLLAVEIAAVLPSAPIGSMGGSTNATPAALVRADSCWVQPGVGVACSVADASATAEVLP